MNTLTAERVLAFIPVTWPAVCIDAKMPLNVCLFKLQQSDSQLFPHRGREEQVWFRSSLFHSSTSHAACSPAADTVQICNLWVNVTTIRIECSVQLKCDCRVMYSSLVIFSLIFQWSEVRLCSHSHSSQWWWLQEELSNWLVPAVDLVWGTMAWTGSDKLQGKDWNGLFTTILTVASTQPRQSKADSLHPRTALIPTCIWPSWSLRTLQSITVLDSHSG